MAFPAGEVDSAERDERIAREQCFMCGSRIERPCPCKGRGSFAMEKPPCTQDPESFPVGVEFVEHPLADGSGYCIMHLCSEACRLNFEETLGAEDQQPDGALDQAAICVIV